MRNGPFVWPYIARRGREGEGRGRGGQGRGGKGRAGKGREGEGREGGGRVTCATALALSHTCMINY